MSTYTPESLERCKKVVRSLNAESGAWGPKCVVIGGLAPSLLTPPNVLGVPPHIGTTDVDVALQVGLAAADDNLYRTLKNVLTNLGFSKGDPSFKWTRNVDGYNVDLELFCSSSLDDAGNIVSKPATEAGSGVSAMGCFGLELVESNNKQVEDEGPLLDDKGIKKVTINVCSPEMLLVLKAWALKDRAKEKDGYDIVWILKA